jgi:hypothetical protein
LIKGDNPLGGEDANKNANAEADAEAPNLDFSDDEISEAAPSAPKVGDDYDPRPQEDGARRTIAYLLIGLLWLIIAAILILLGCGTINVADLKEFAVVLGPIVTLVSAATGFYYGTKSKS